MKFIAERKDPFLGSRFFFVASRAATIRVDPDNRYQTREQRNAYVDEVLRLRLGRAVDVTTPETRFQ